MNQPEIRVHSEEMEIINPDHLCPEGIDNLFIHHLLTKKDDIFLRKGCLNTMKSVFRKGDMGFDAKDLLPRKINPFSPSLCSDHHTSDHRIGFSPLSNQIRELAHFQSQRIINSAIQEIAEKVEIFQIQFHKLFRVSKSLFLKTNKVLYNERLTPQALYNDFQGGCQMEEGFQIGMVFASPSFIS